jgi:hypothetical protein
VRTWKSQEKYKEKQGKKQVGIQLLRRRPEKTREKTKLPNKFRLFWEKNFLELFREELEMKRDLSRERDRMLKLCTR